MLQTGVVHKKRTPGDFIREVIQKTGLRQYEVAAQLQVSSVAVSNWVRDVHFPDPITLQRLLNLLPERVNVGDCLRLPDAQQDEIRAIAREEAQLASKKLKEEMLSRPQQVAHSPPKRKAQ